MSQSAFEKTLEIMGYEPKNTIPQSTLGRLLRQTGPQKTREFRRIHNLPRRVWEGDPTLPELTRLLTAYMRKTQGTMVLWPIQAAGLREIYEVGGLFGPMAVSSGKTLITLLAPVLLEAERPLLVVPATLREQTRQYVIPEMSKHWRLHPNLTVMGYTELSLEKNSEFLVKHRPDLIICDEVHRLKNTQAGRTKRFIRYMREHPETKFVALSGTVTNRSIKDYAHILRWCLGDRAPLPESWRELSQWADALDVLKPGEEPSPAGALEVWAVGGSVRKGYRDRLVQTPGVIATKETELGVSLQILSRRPAVPDHVASLIQTMTNQWVTPYGEEITEAVDLWRHVRELACGFYYRWEPPPPVEWLVARKAWKTYVRQTLLHNRRKLDTELQVWNEAAAAKRPPPEWVEWVAVKDTYEINTVAEWVSDYALRDATEWLNNLIHGGGIVWTEHNAFGVELAKFSGFPYFGAGPKANVGILEHKGPCIASIRAHCEGKNLQHHQSRNLIVTPPSSGKTWEQLLGRTHRHGQLADEVTAEVYTQVAELVASFRQAVRDAHYLEHTLGSRQKLLYASIAFDYSGAI